MRLLDARDRGGMRFLLFCGRWPVAQHGLKAQLLALDQRPFQIARLWWRARFPQRREGSSDRVADVAHDADRRGIPRLAQVNPYNVARFR